MRKILLALSIVIAASSSAFALDCPAGPDPWGYGRPSEWVQSYIYIFDGSHGEIDSVAVVHRDVCRGDPSITGDVSLLNYWWADLYCFSDDGCRASDWADAAGPQYPQELRIHPRRRVVGR